MVGAVSSGGLVFLYTDSGKLALKNYTCRVFFVTANISDEKVIFTDNG